MKIIRVFSLLCLIFSSFNVKLISQQCYSQDLVEISGVTNYDFLRISYNQKQKYYHKPEMNPLEFMELIDIYDYSTLIETWHKDRYNEEYNAYNEDSFFDLKFQIDLGFTFEGTTKNNEYIRLNITDRKKFLLGQIKYGFSTFSEEAFFE
jgi:Fe-S cluster assembly ATPase SufC